MNSRQKVNAFSLIEMLVVILILVILLAILIPAISKISHKAEIIACAGNLKKLSKAFHLYLLENDGYAPFNRKTNDLGDNFYAWETMYLLGPYLGDSQHKKFESGDWDVVTCPGNRCEFYHTGSAIDKATGTGYDSSWQNRQAPLVWPVVDNWSGSVATDAVPGEDCSPGRLVVDYHYNTWLGGTARIWKVDKFIFAEYYNDDGGGGLDWTRDLPRRDYPAKNVVRFPHETVVFCDIQWANILDSTSGGVDTFEYGFQGDRIWKIPQVGLMRTNERVHNGLGINAVFFDGHIEFLAPHMPYNGSDKIEDDILNWGISLPILLPNEPQRIKQIPGIHGFRRKITIDTSMLAEFATCIEHETLKGLPGQTYNDCADGL